MPQKSQIDELQSSIDLARTEIGILRENLKLVFEVQTRQVLELEEIKKVLKLVERAINVNGPRQGGHWFAK